MVIEGKHNLTNKTFVKAILEEAINIFEEQRADSLVALTLARELIKRCSLPSSELATIMNIVAPKMAITAKKEYAANILGAMDEPDVVELAPSELEQIPSATFSTASDSKSALRKDVLKIVGDLDVVTVSFLEKQFGARANALGMTLHFFLANHFTLGELVYSYKTEIVAKPGFNADWAELSKKIIQENGHRPFTANVLAERLGISADEARQKVRNRKAGSLILWTEYDVWSFLDIKDAISKDKTKERIEKCLKLHGDIPIPIDDLFNCIFVGVIATNYYSEIFADTKVDCVRQALLAINQSGYEYDSNSKRFRKKQNVLKTKPLYRVF